jgi:YfiR/HmsC-like
MGPLIRKTWTAFVLLAAGVMYLRAEPPAALEYRVKAAYLLNFAKFVDWPTEESPATQLTICVIGDDPFGNALDQLVQGEAVGERRIVVQRHAGAPQHGKCDVAFLGKTTREQPRILEELGPGVLTVGEGETFLRSGGIIAFVIENRKVRFDVSQTAARNASVRLSSRLLGVARTVK